MYLSEDQNAFLTDIYEKMRTKVSAECRRMEGRIPYIPTDGRYTDQGRQIHAWTNGFWGGMMWQMYHDVQDETYKREAEALEKRLDEALDNVEKLDHDVGFIWLHTAVARYRLTGDADARKKGLKAAAVLASRYCPEGEYIKAWNHRPESQLIVDCLMNLPLLFWAADEGAGERYRRIACRHLDTVLRYIVREDGSCNHMVIFDEASGEVLDLPGGQGYEKGSSWTRGQAWAVYGLALAYRYTKDDRYLQVAKRVAHYFIANIAVTGFVSLQDFRAPQEPVYYDTTAAACAACGFMELAEWVGEYEKPLYEKAAWNVMQALTKEFSDWNTACDGILQGGSVKYHDTVERNVPIIYGDYFLLELILRLKGQDFLIW